MKLIDESFEKRMNAKFDSLQGQVKHLVEAVNTLVAAIEVMGGLEEEQLERDLDGNEIPPDREEGLPL